MCSPAMHASAENFQECINKKCIRVCWRLTKMSNGNMVVVVRIHIEVYNKKTTQRATQLGGLWERHEFGKYLIKKKKTKIKIKRLNIRVWLRKKISI